MFKDLSFLQTDKKSLKLQTRKGRDIENYQILDTDKTRIQQQMDNLKLKYLGILIRPNTISSIYNCHGLTLASRRTGIDIIDLNLLREDDIAEIKKEELLPGDIVIYLDDENGMEHSGIIIVADNAENNIFDVRVLSKWGDGSEVIHNLYQCPYNLNNIKFYRCNN